jgi:hypothetical protein
MVVQKAHLPLRALPGGKASVEYGIQPKSPILTQLPLRSGSQFLASCHLLGTEKRTF